MINKITDKISQGIKLMGVYTSTLVTIDTPKKIQLVYQINWLRERGYPYMHLVQQLNAMAGAKKYKDTNLIVTSGLTLIANSLAQTSPDNDPKLDFTSLGTDSTAVNTGQTKLVAETYRRETASASNSGGVVYLSAYYDATETDGLFKEAGVWANATATADSGVLFSRVLLNSGSGINKTTSQTLTLDYTITITV